MTAHMLGNKSIDSTIKTYGPNWKASEVSDRNADQEVIYAATDEILKTVNPSLRRLLECDPRAGGVSAIAAQTALCRLRGSLDASSLLSRLGLAFEALSVCRLIMEQSAWAYAIHDQDERTVYRTSPTKAIRRLRMLFPEAGRLYGELSELSHMIPGTASHYLHISNEAAYVLIRAQRLGALGTFFLLYVADILAVVTEIVSAPYIDQEVLESVRVGPSGLAILPTRPTKELIQRFSGDLIKVANSALSIKVSARGGVE